MDLNTLSSVIKYLLIDNDRVSIFGIGNFIIENTEAFFSDNGNTINPPRRKVVFESADAWDDGLILKRYSEISDLPPNIIKANISSLFTGIKTNLENGNKVYLPEFGEFSLNSQKKIDFTMNEGVDFNINLSGLEAISLEEIIENPTQATQPISLEEDNLTLSEKDIDLLKNLDDENLVIEDSEPKLEPIIEKVESENTTQKTNNDKGFSNPKKVEKNPTNNNMSQLIIITAISLITIVAVIFLFKDDISILLDKWLYTPEERELIQNWGEN